jgi:hypothetical protein
MPHDNHSQPPLLVLATALLLVALTLLAWSRDLVDDDAATGGVSLILGISWAWLIWQRQRHS